MTDTAAKRRNASAIVVPLIPGVTSDASKGIEWRYAAAWAYSDSMATTNRARVAAASSWVGGAEAAQGFIGGPVAAGDWQGGPVAGQGQV